MAWIVSSPCPSLPQASPQRRGRQASRSCSRRRGGRRRLRNQTMLWDDFRGRSGIVASAASEGVVDGSPSTSSEISVRSSARAQLDLLDQLTSGSESESEDGYYTRTTIREQLIDIVDGRIGDFAIPLGKRFDIRKIKLTISQKRNIKRQAYLNDVSRRNDSQFFAVIGAFVLLPPLIILAVSILTGYVQLFP